MGIINGGLTTLSLNIIGERPYAIALKNGDDEISIGFHPSRAQSWTQEDMERVMDEEWVSIGARPFVDVGSSHKMDMLILPYLGGNGIYVSDSMYVGAYMGHLSHFGKTPFHLYDFKSLTFSSHLPPYELEETPLFHPLARARYMRRVLLS